jgi:hypothetical protein
MELPLGTILTIRWLVLKLGQSDGHSWWPCSFLSALGERYLATPFPRSAFWAGFHASTVAAARHHDERIGAGGASHLFRLGQDVEFALRDAVLRDGWRPDIDNGADKGILLKALQDLGPPSVTDQAVGPVRVSDPKRLTGPKTLSQIAGLYAAAFMGGFQALPYGSEK